VHFMARHTGVCLGRVRVGDGRTAAPARMTRHASWVSCRHTHRVVRRGGAVLTARRLTARGVHEGLVRAQCVLLLLDHS
jgi:hypothetical protein